MRPDLAHMLDEALERLRAGATIEECLLAYPEHAAELEPMLRTAAAIQRQAVAALPPSLEQWLASGRREIEQIARATYTRPETLGQRLARQLGSFFAGLSRRGGARVASAALSALIICFMSFYTVDAAAARSLPGEYLYSWKLLSEQARISLAADPDRRTRLVAASVERRVAEIAALTERGTSSPALLSETVQRLEDQVSQTLSTLPAASPDTAERTAARVGRLLARAQSDLQAASAPDADSAIVIESAAAEVANLIEDLPAPPPADAAAVVPLPNATADPGAELAEATARPTRAPSATAPPIAVIDRPAGGVSTPGRAPAEAAPGLPEPGAPQSPSGPGEDPSGPIAPTASATRPPSTRTPGPTRTAQPTRTPGPTRTALPTRTPAPTLTPAAPAPGGAGDLPVPTATASATVAPIGEPVVPPTNTATSPPPPTATPTRTATPSPTETAPPPTATPSPTDEPTPTAIGDDRLVAGLRPLLACVAVQSDGRYMAYFGFRNNRPGPTAIAVGPDNYFVPGPEDRGQPTEFPIGRSDPFPTFSVLFDGEPLTWFLGNRQVTASRETRPCPADMPQTVQDIEQPAPNAPPAVPTATP